jgi:succinate dehydrogenase / fumarate reductase cytochrome b subunit
MSIAIGRENFILHKLHSLTGIVPVGYYMAQHLVLNSFSVAGESYFNGVIAFFDSMPIYVLLAMETLFIWIPLAFHAVYGLIIVGHAQPNFIGTRYGWSQNRMFTFQRWSGVFLFFALIIHVCTTTGAKYLHPAEHSEMIKYAAWHAKLLSNGCAWLIFYMVMVLFASYHLGYGLWNFCIRWGITISDRAQIKVQQASFLVFVALTLIGWAALAGFLIHNPSSEPVNAFNSGYHAPARV